MTKRPEQHRDELPPIPDQTGLESLWPHVYGSQQGEDKFGPRFVSEAPTDPKVDLRGAAERVNWWHRDFEIDEVEIGREIEHLIHLRQTYGRALLDMDLHDRDRNRDAERVRRWMALLAARDLALVNALRDRRQRPDAARRVIREEIEFYASQLEEQPYPWQVREEIPAENLKSTVEELREAWKLSLYSPPPSTRGPDKQPRRTATEVSAPPPPPAPPQQRRAKKASARETRVLRMLRRHPAGLSKRELRDLLKMGNVELAKSLDSLERRGDVEHRGSLKDSKYLPTKRMNRTEGPEKSPEE